MPSKKNKRQRTLTKSERVYHNTIAGCLSTEPREMNLTNIK